MHLQFSNQWNYNFNFQGYPPWAMYLFFFFVRYYYLPRKLFQLLPFGVWVFRFKRAEPDVSINSIAV